MPPVKRSKTSRISWSPYFLMNLNSGIEKVRFLNLKTGQNRISGSKIVPKSRSASWLDKEQFPSVEKCDKKSRGGPRQSAEDGRLGPTNTSRQAPPGNITPGTLREALKSPYDHSTSCLRGTVADIGNIQKNQIS